ncbi:hypothetical protein NLI96_g1833 [Meripilus lineatus]|uniref:F-box domain-containing protein n=1 Tax=Meripilus lineatus TaxID=2056292 RepID=A0AAD5YHZ8_9APHY|nr:hypothetical protein NLI96_g1833 [Physisporinus lineatus]
MSSIFREYAHSHHKKDEDLSPFTLLPIIHTCRNWRLAAFSVASLWSFIVVSTHPSWTETLLKLSRKEPLIVHAFGPPSQKASFDQSLKVVLSQFSRVQEIHLSIPDESIGSFATFFHIPAPLLSVLDINILGRGVVDIAQVPETGLCSVKEISLRNITLPFVHSAMRPTIRRLSFDILAANEPQDPNFTQKVLILLEALPLLQELQIRSDVTSMPTYRRAVTLPHLHRLALDAHCNILGWLLGCMRFPYQASLLLTCKPWSGHSCVSFITSVASHLEGYLQQTSATPPLHMHVSPSRANDFELHVRLWHVRESTSSMPNSSEVPAVDLLIPTNPSPDVDFEKLLHPLPLSSVQELHFGLAKSIPLSTPSSPFGLLEVSVSSMRELEFLILDGWPESSVSGILEQSTPGEAPESFLFPCLKELVLRNLQYGCSDPGDTGNSTYKPLWEALQSRMKNGSPIRRLALESAIGFFADDVDTLDGVVNGMEFDWDGVEILEQRLGH